MAEQRKDQERLALAIAQECYGVEPEITALSSFNNYVFRLRLPGWSRILKLAKGTDGESIRKELGLFGLLKQHGVPVPAVERADPDGALVDRPFIIMVSAGDRTVLDWVARPGVVADRLFAEMGSVLATIHGIALTDGNRPDGVAPRDPVTTVERVYAMADWAARAGLLASDAIARFKSMSVPPLRGDRLCHGDFHAVQCIVGGTSIMAVVDWESAWIGNPLVDLAVAWTYIEYYGQPGLMERFLAGYGSIREDFSTAYRSVRLAHCLAMLVHAAGRQNQSLVNRAVWLFRKISSCAESAYFGPSDSPGRR